MNHESVKKVIILGTGGNCIDILESLLDINAGLSTKLYDIQGFLDDDPKKQNHKIDGFPVLGSLKDAARYEDCYFVNGIGSINNYWRRKEIVESTNISKDRFISVVHPTSYISSSAKLGVGVVVFQQATITNHVVMGDFVVILPQSILSHDVVIGDYTCIAGGVNISGGAQVGALSFLGSGASVIGSINIGSKSLVGLGSVVLKDVPDNVVVAGVPARIIRATIEG